MADEDDLDAMTKAELLDWALDHGQDLPNNNKKAEILEACLSDGQAADAVFDMGTS